MKISIFLIAILWPFMNVFAQVSQTTNELQVGQPVPEIVFDHLYNSNDKQVKLSALKGKLVILDFWASWCGPCVKSFPKLDSIQAAFGDQIQIILVNSKRSNDSDEKVKSVYEGWKSKTGKVITLPSVLQDTVATLLFKHQLLPHYVWISAEGKYLAATTADDIIKATIKAVLEGVPVVFGNKKDQQPEQYLFSSHDLPAKGVQQYSVFVKGRYPGLPSGNRYRTTDGVVHGRSMTNSSLYELYQSVLQQLEPGLTPRQFLLEVKDPAVLNIPKDEKAIAAWSKEHLYSIDVVVLVEKAKELYPIMLDYLNLYSGYKGEIVTRKMPCFLLTWNGDSLLLKSKGAKRMDRLRAKEKPFLTNASIKSFVYFLNEFDVLRLPVFDETGLGFTVDLQFEKRPASLTELNEELKKYGLELKEAVREMKVFVLKEAEK